MKLIRIGKIGEESPGLILEDDRKIDVSNFGEDYNETFFATGGLSRLESWLPENEGLCRVINPDERLGPPVSGPSKIICIGLNYSDHAKEAGMDIPEEPIIFFKSTTSLVGPNDPVMIPRNATKLDWEVELAVIIGMKAGYVSEEDAMSYVAGYSVLNDYSERSFQLERGGQWVKGKSCDTFSPLGPFLATKDEIPNPNNLDLWLTVNGAQRQKSNTSNFVFNVAEVVSYVSQFMTLLPGDVISTGTPPGVGMGMSPPQYLREGDLVELGIDGLGSSKQLVTSYKD
jgi:2-keto-4-pentenoate hydratase/2-oxohepta-3-ene-1,7-dioic acid hydratase in catechol pathway